MSYQVLARKWRPQIFSELVGQQHVVDAITNALENDKLHHAYLFTGTRGVGKTTIARIFSKSLNCEKGQSANPCGVCNACTDISEGRYVDLLEIDAASRTKVEDTREILDNVQYRPTRGKYKVYLIDEVHMLSKHSFNALLKTLEEPPEHVKFLLATTDPQKLPVTILSRCLQFSLKAISVEQIKTHLAMILDSENIPYDDAAIAQIAKSAHGSIRDSLSLTDQAIAQGNNTVLTKTVISMLGLLDRNQVLKLIKLICERDSISAMKQLEEICSASPDHAQVLSQILGLLHQIGLTQMVPEICKLEGSSAKAIYTLAKAVSAEHIQMLYQIGINGQRDLPFAPDSRSGLQMCILRMLAFSPRQKIELVLDDLSKDNSQIDSVSIDTSLSDAHKGSKPESTDAQLPQDPNRKSPNDHESTLSENDEGLDVSSQRFAETESSTETADSKSTRNDGSAHTSNKKNEFHDENSKVNSEVSSNIQSNAQSNRGNEAFVQTLSAPDDKTTIIEEAVEDIPSRVDDNSIQDDSHLDVSVHSEEDYFPPQGEQGFDEDAFVASAQEVLSSEDKSAHFDENMQVALSSEGDDCADTKEANNQTLDTNTLEANAESSLNNTLELLKAKRELEAFSKENSEKEEPSAKKSDEGDTSASEPTVTKLSENNTKENVLQNTHVSETAKSESQVTQEDVFGSDIAEQELPLASPHATTPKTRETSDYEEHSHIDPNRIQNISLGYIFKETEKVVNPHLTDGEKLVKASQIDEWSAFVDETGLSALTRQLLLHANCTSLNNPLKIVISEEHQHLCENAILDKIKARLSEMFNQSFKLEVTTGQVNNTPFQIQANIDSMRQQYAETLVSNDDTIQEIIKAFDATVLEESIEAR